MIAKGRHRNGKEGRPREVTEIHADEATKLRRLGLSYRAIANRLNLGYGTIRRLVHKDADTDGTLGKGHLELIR